uniref:Solute carrier family 35 member B1 n=1 Tax=Romanomermis culicivorax TaxID=13658 RepID=A0A915JWE8_ROMCU
MFKSHIKLIGCALGIIVCYGIFGVVQEAITKATYSDGESELKFTFSQELVFIQCLINALFAYLVILLTNPASDDTPTHMYAFSSFSYTVAMICTNQALQYISYPYQRYSWSKYVNVFLIVFGVALFMYKDTHKTGIIKSHFDFGMGEIFIIISLLMDGTTGAIQDRMRAHCKVEWHHMMLQMNVWSSLYLTISILLTGDFFSFIGFIKQFPYVLGYMALFALSSAVGQFFVFVTVTEFGPLNCSIITTIRKVITILASVLIFGNLLTIRQTLAATIVFVALFLDAFYGKKKVK